MLDCSIKLNIFLNINEMYTVKVIVFTGIGTFYRR